MRTLALMFFGIALFSIGMYVLLMFYYVEVFWKFGYLFLIPAVVTTIIGIFFSLDTRP
jgi:hypothetical protein